MKLQLWVALDEAKQAIEEKRKTIEMLASQVEQTQKLIEEMIGRREDHDPLWYVYIFPFLSF